MECEKLCQMNIYLAKNSSRYIFFGRHFDYDVLQTWMTYNRHIMYLLVASYLVMVWGIRKYMVSREPLDLRHPLILWNAALAVYSWFVVLMVFPEFVAGVRRYGLKGACNIGIGKSADVYFAIICLSFLLSKIVEFGDTLFLLLMKRRVLFLHWYHHSSTLFFVWSLGEEISSIVQWLMPINASVHAFMYTYFTLKSLQVKVSRWIAMCITSLQIVQFISNIYIILLAYSIKRSGGACDTSYRMLNISFFVYFSYIVLFGKFFFDAYIATPQNRKLVADKNK